MSIGKNELVISENLVITKELNNILSVLLTELASTFDTPATEPDSTTSPSTVCDNNC
jgi:hypothetical protein